MTTGRHLAPRDDAATRRRRVRKATLLLVALLCLAPCLGCGDVAEGHDWESQAWDSACQRYDDEVGKAIAYSDGWARCGIAPIGVDGTWCEFVDQQGGDQDAILLVDGTWCELIDRQDGDRDAILLVRCGDGGLRRIRHGNVTRIETFRDADGDDEAWAEWLCSAWGTPSNEVFLRLHLPASPSKVSGSWYES